MKPDKSPPSNPPSPRHFTFVARFVCGFVLGIIFTLSWLWWGGLEDWVILGLITIISGLVCGWLTWRFGDRFVKALIKWL